jgi:glycosyltransferase involved in cell wall biosynthesis
VWFETLQKADWGEAGKVDFFNVNIHRSLETLGKTRLKSIPENLKLYRKLKKQLKNTKYNLVLIPVSQETIGFIKDSFFIRIAAKRVNKVLLMLHGSNFQNWQNNSSKRVRKYTAATLKKTDGMIVLGQNLKSLFTNHYSPNQVHIVPNGANFEFPEKAQKSNDKITILYLSNLLSAKGITDLIDALVLLTSDKNKYDVNVVGQWVDEATKAYCLNLVKKHQLPVNFKGPLYGEEKLEQFAAADVFVFPPRAPEGHPLVLVEAMAAGLPIISTDQGAITESVIDSKNGFIVDSKSPEEIAEKLLWLIKNPKERSSMGQESRKMYERFFTQKTMIENFKKIFTKILAEA